MRVFFKKNKPARKWNPNAGCSAANHWAKKFLKKFEGTQPCPAKKSSNYFLKKSQIIDLKYHIRVRKPVYHRKTRIRQKNREIQGTQPCPAEKKFPVFLNSYQRKPRLFSKPKTAPKLQFSVFFQKKKRKKQTRIKRKRGWNPLY